MGVQLQMDCCLTPVRLGEPNCSKLSQAAEKRECPDFPDEAGRGFRLLDEQTG